MSMDWKDDVIQAYNEHCKYLGNMLAEESKFKFQLMDVITNMEANIKSLTETLNNTRSLLETCQEKLKEKESDVDVQNVIKEAVANNGIVTPKDYSKIYVGSEVVD